MHLSTRCSPLEILCNVDSLERKVLTPHLFVFDPLDDFLTLENHVTTLPANTRLAALVAVTSGTNLARNRDPAIGRFTI